MARIALLSFALMLGLTSQAQFDFNTDKFIDNLIGDVRSDRPGHSISAQTCGFVTLQLQTGYRFQKNVWDSGPTGDSYNSRSIVPTTFKIGLSNNLEINTSFSYQHVKSYFSVFDLTTTDARMQSTFLGFRYSFLKGEGIVPSLALQSSMRFKRPSIGLDRMGSEFILAANNNFGKFNVLSNIGVAWIGDGSWQTNKEPNAVPYVLNLSYNFGKVTGFIEAYGDILNPNIALDGGVAFKIGSDFVFDIYGGCANDLDIANNWFVEAGLTYRFSFMKMMAKKKADQFFKK